MRINIKHPDARLKKRMLRILSGSLAILLIVFCFYQFTSFFRVDVETMLVTKDSIELSVEGEGLLIRREQPLVSSAAGMIAPLALAGERVRKDDPMLTVYTAARENSAAYSDLQSSIARIRRAIAEEDTLADLSSIAAEKALFGDYLTEALRRGDAASATVYRDAIRILSLREDDLTSDREVLKEALSSLLSACDALLASAGTAAETLTAPVGGYYYPENDGYGDLLPDVLSETLTGGEIRQWMERIDAEPSVADADIVGTLVIDAKWYLAVPMELPLAGFTAGEEYTLIFSAENGERIPMTLERAIEGNGDEPSLLLFSSRRMPSGFSFSRRQQVKIVTGTQSGFSIPASALHRLDGETGIYILEGSVMCFCRVEILHDLGARYLVKTTDPTPGGEYAENTYRYVRHYDLLVLSGGRLFHGRVLS